MRKITLNRTRLSNVVDNQINMLPASTQNDYVIHKTKLGFDGFGRSGNEKRVNFFLEILPLISFRAF